LITGRAERAVIVVPDSLVYQWFVEMLKKFNLSFATINHETGLAEGENPFEDQQLFIVSLRYLMQNDWLAEFMLNDLWDMIIVDEAHQLRWSPEGGSPEYNFIEKLAHHTEGLVLLSGTPEILGLAGHFARLKLLDPQRFHDYVAYERFTEQGPIAILQLTEGRCGMVWTPSGRGFSRVAVGVLMWRVGGGVFPNSR
jgi:ATP-dependent helicase HepA